MWIQMMLYCMCTYFHGITWQERLYIPVADRVNTITDKTLNPCPSFSGFWLVSVGHYLCLCVYICALKKPLADSGNIPHGVQPCATSCLMWSICLRHKHQTPSVSYCHHPRNETLFPARPTGTPFASLAFIPSVRVTKSISYFKLSAEKIIK